MTSEDFEYQQQLKMTRENKLLSAVVVRYVM